MSRHEGWKEEDSGTPSKKDQTASHLKRNKEKIIDLWEREVKEKLPEKIRNSPVDLRDDLPDFLESLLIALSSEDIESQAAPIIDFGRKHAEARLGLGEYKVDQVLFEFVTLRKVILIVLRDEGPLTESSVDLIINSIESGMTNAVSIFAQEQLKKLETIVSRLQHTLYASQIGLWELDIVSGSFWKSEAFDTLFGLSNDLTPWSLDRLFTLVSSEDRENVRRSILEELNKTFKVECEFRVKWPDTSTHWLRANVRLDLSSRGMGKRMFGAIWDITEQKNREEERALLLRLSQMDLEDYRSERALREKFVITLTHDLRNPISATKLCLELLLRSPGDANSRERLIRRSQKSIDRVDQMIRDLLDANALQAGQKLPIRPSPCDLRTVVQDVIQDFDFIFGDRFVLNAPSVCQGNWDCTQLRRVIENLLSNAAKYGMLGSQILVTLQKERETVLISVHNEGQEIEAKNLERLFDLFQREVTRGTQLHRGWGIGLSLVRGITEAHGGQVKVESAPGKGTTFIIELPVMAPETFAKSVA